MFINRTAKLAGFTLTAVLAGAFLAPAANATPYVIKLVQHEHNVTGTGSGAIDLTGLAFARSVPSFGANIAPLGDELLIGNGLNGFDVYFANITGPLSFGTKRIAFASSASGDPVALEFDHPGVPIGYVSDTALSNSATWDNASFASLGVTPGRYTWTWGGGADQSVTLATAVPEPAALGMFGLGVLLIGGFVTLRRREQRQC